MPDSARPGVHTTRYDRVMRLLALALMALPAAPQAADTLYINGSIVTMDARGSVTQAMAVQGGRVVRAGTNQEVRKLAAPSARVVDLAGRTVIPGLYAAHDHFPSAGITALYQVDLNSPPIGTVEKMDDLVALLRQRAEKSAPGEWIVGRGYDDTLLREKRHPTRSDLDRASTTHPIVIIHTSGHLSSGNSLALEKCGVTRATANPSGGVIRKDSKTGEPTGVVEESGILRRLLPAHSLPDRLKAIEWCDREYVAKGVTTTVIAGNSRQGVEDLAEAIRKRLVHLRIVSMMGPDARPSVKGDAVAGIPRERLHIAGVKLWQDGSLQGYTGYLGAPYHIQPEGKQDYRGYPSRSREALLATVRKLHAAGHQLAIHANGDAAIDDVLSVYEQVQKETPRPDARHRIEHCQTPREDQLDTILRLGVTPSFFNGHVFYWGDRHRDIFLGPARGARISPLAGALRRGIRFTFHNDTPVTPVDPLRLVWTAVARQTRDGRTLGEAERIGVKEALRAVTLDAAWQNFEEADKGSLEPGKLADFVVLDRDPLKIAPAQLRDVQVLETVVGGETAYRLQR
jgi:predicted amidohydrolase YtcJ